MSCKYIHWIDISFWAWLLWDLWKAHKENKAQQETIWKLQTQNMDLECEKERLHRYLTCTYDHGNIFWKSEIYCSKCGFTGSEFARDT